MKKHSETYKNKKISKKEFEEPSLSVEGKDEQIEASYDQEIYNNQEQQTKERLAKSLEIKGQSSNNISREKEMIQRDYDPDQKDKKSSLIPFTISLILIICILGAIMFFRHKIRTSSS